MTRICTICARSGSKGVKNKNIRLLRSKPLIAYTLIQAQESALFDLIAVSSDSDEILDIARKYGSDLLVKRPANLATDHAAKIPAIRHCVLTAEKERDILYDVIVDLSATSPLRLPEDIRNAVELLENKKVSNVITAAPARRSPYFDLVELKSDNVVGLSKPTGSPVVRRQDSPKCYDMNGSIYAWHRRALFEYPTVFNTDTQLYIMPEERSVDIDSYLDFDIAQMLMKKKAAADNNA
ncbi:MAG: acylneuraminate cytidylyltransferase family protein [Candidatus Electrothrix sp. AR5]|nr:acylneuraminate cytidylyltransferase family protein [Candidatus Electrothrix sp. AR5]